MNKLCVNKHHQGDRLISISNFSKRSTSPDGHYCWCKQCCKITSRLKREQTAAIQGRVLPIRDGQSSPTIKSSWPTSFTPSQKVTALLQNIRRRCIYKNIPFSVTLTDLTPLPMVCPDLHIPIEYNNRRSATHNSASVDRIIPSLGYVPGNVRIVSRQANVMKQNASPTQLVQIAKSWLTLFEDQID